MSDEIGGLEKSVKWIKSLPLDVQLMILKIFSLDKFIIVSDILDIKLNNKVKYIMTNYSFYDYLYLDKNIKVLKDARQIISAKIKESNLEIDMNYDDLDDYYGVIRVKWLEELKSIKEKVKNGANIYWITLSTNFDSKINKNTFPG